MPPIGVITGGVDFSSTFIPLNGEHYDSLAAARQAGAPTMNIGLLINNVISFLIAAFILFMPIEAMNQLRASRRRSRKAAAALPRSAASRGNSRRPGEAQRVRTRMVLLGSGL
jgi:large conductance mechanosensitive channel